MSSAPPLNRSQSVESTTSTTSATSTTSNTDSSGVGRLLRSGSGSRRGRLFKGQSKKKAQQQQQQQQQQENQVPNEAADADGAGFKLLRRSSSTASQIALRCLQKVRANRALRESEQSTQQPSVRFNLAKNKNHCYEDENYMYNNRQHKSNAYEFSDGAGGDGDIESQDATSIDEYQYYYYGEDQTRHEPRHGSLPEETEDDLDAAEACSINSQGEESSKSHESPQYAILVERASTADSTSTVSESSDNDPSEVDRPAASITTDSFCNEYQGQECSRCGGEQPTFSCSRCTGNEEETSSKPTDMERRTRAAAAAKYQSSQAALVRSPSKRKTSHSDETETDSGSSAKRVFIKTNAGQQSEVEHRIEHLKAEIQKEQGIERQALTARELSQSLSSRTTDEEICADRLLLLSGIKIGKCQSELKQLQQSLEEGGIRRHGSESAEMFNPLQLRPCVATIHLSDICLPLHLGFLSSLGREGVGQFMIAARCGADVVASTNVKSTCFAASLSSGIVFDETLTLERVHSDSHIDIEVYYFTTSNKSQEQSTPTKSRLLPGDGKKSGRGHRGTDYTASPAKSPAPAPFVPKTSRFQLAASSSLSLVGLQKHTQIKLQEWSGQHVVFGHVFATVTGKAHYVEHQQSGFLTWKEEVAGIPNWRRLWCEQAGSTIRAWQYPSDKNTKDPAKIIDLLAYSRKKYSLRIDQGVSVRKYALMLTAMPPHQIKKSLPELEVETHVFSADSKPECSLWVDAIYRCIGDLEIWQSLPSRHDENVELSL